MLSFLLSTAALCYADGYRDLSEKDNVFFGVWDQDRNYENGSEPVEWIVLTVENDRALLLSRYVISADPLDMKKDTPVFWQNSYLRVWLNRSFYDDAFSDEEKARIIEVRNINDSNPEASDVSDTKDRIFLLSIDEVSKYTDDSVRKPEENDFRNSWPKHSRSGDAYFQWWLRSNGQAEGKIAYVDPEGNTNTAGADYYSGNIGIRPALWIDLRPAGELEPVHYSGLQKLMAQLTETDRLHLNYQLYDGESGSPSVVDTNMKDGIISVRITNNEGSSVKLYRDGHLHKLFPETETALIPYEDFHPGYPLRYDPLYSTVGLLYSVQIDYTEEDREFNGELLHAEIYHREPQFPESVFYFNDDGQLTAYSEILSVFSEHAGEKELYVINAIDDKVDETFFDISSYTISTEEAPDFPFWD